MYTQEERGAVPGHHQVTISTYIEADDSSPDPKIQQGRKEIIPVKYNAQTILEARLPDRSQVDFQLESK